MLCKDCIVSLSPILFLLMLDKYVDYTTMLNLLKSMKYYTKEAVLNQMEKMYDINLKDSAKCNEKSMKFIHFYRESSFVSSGTFMSNLYHLSFTRQFEECERVLQSCIR